MRQNPNNNRRWQPVHMNAVQPINMMLAHAQVRTSLLLGGTAALVDLSDPAKAPEVLQAAAGWDGVKVRVMLYLE